MMRAAAQTGCLATALLLALSLAPGLVAAQTEADGQVASRSEQAEAPAGIPEEAPAAEQPAYGPPLPPPLVPGGEADGEAGIAVGMPETEGPPPPYAPRFSLRPRSRGTPPPPAPAPPGDGGASPAPLEFSAGQQVFVAVAIDCADQADFLRGYWSIVETLAADAPLLTVRPREHIVMLANHHLPVTDETGADSVVYGDYWCIPKRAFCYETAAEGAFGSNHPLGEQLGVDPAMTATVQNGIVRAAKELLARHCNRTWEADR